MAKQCVIVGGGGFGREVACWARATPAFADATIGYLDDRAGGADAFPAGTIYLGAIAGYTPTAAQEFLLAIGDPEDKRRIVAELRARGARFASLVHPTAVVAVTAQLGIGVVLCPQAVVSANATVGDFVIVNIATSVGHDVRIGAYSTLSAHVDLTGGVVLGEGVQVGSGARVLPGKTVGDSATVGAGAVVMRNVETRTTVYAPAAKRL